MPLERMPPSYLHGRYFCERCINEYQRSFNHYTRLSTPLVSIIIPVYNAMPYLRDALSSVLAQDYSNIEIWVADDDSTDGSYEYALEKAGQDARLNVIRLGPKAVGERRTAVALN